jgi:hypothetical protein
MGLWKYSFVNDTFYFSNRVFWFSAKSFFRLWTTIPFSIGFQSFYDMFLNNFKDVLEAYSLSKICKVVLEYTLKMFSTYFIIKEQENLVDNKKCQAGFRPQGNKILNEVYAMKA